MRFVCDSCRAQYMISDDKVGANGVKVRCKKCGNVIVVRRQQDTEADAALRGLEETPQPPAPEAPTGENSIFSDVDDDEIGAAFESALGERQDDEPVAPPEDEPPPEANLPPVSDGPPRAHDWYVAIDDKQTGPLTPDAIKDHWDRGEIGPDSLTWRQGFEDWVPLSEVSELAGWLAPRPQRPVALDVAHRRIGSAVWLAWLRKPSLRWNSPSKRALRPSIPVAPFQERSVVLAP